MYGTQTRASSRNFILWFENDVNMYGTQTIDPASYGQHMFENDVNMYGTQTTYIQVWFKL